MKKSARRTPWATVIQRARERKKAGKVAFTMAQRLRACDWPQCAIGELDPPVPVYQPEAVPKDDALRELGCKFATAVYRADSPWSAARILRAIEKRAAEVLREVKRG